MALTDKDILITPNDGSSTADPKTEFTGANSSASDTITLETQFDGSITTLSYEGSAGQLFSISNDLSGTIFAVNDSSGIPSLEINNNGEIRLSEFDGNVIVGNTNSTPLSSLFEGRLIVKGSGDQDPIMSVTDSTSTGSAAGVFHQSSTSPSFPAFVVNSAANSSSTSLISAYTNVNNTTGVSGTEVFKVTGQGNLTITGQLTSSTVNTGQGATEVHLMNQNVRTTDAVTFATVNTGQGANELYAMNQNVRTTDAVTFATVNTGQGATEVHLMNQNLRTTDSPTFATLNVTGDLNITGDINTTSVSNLDVVDKVITIGKGGTASGNTDGGIIVDGANAKLTWNNSNSYWQMNKKLAFNDTATTTNQGLGIIWSGFDKEGTTDFSDNASIVHTTNAGGLAGSVLLLTSQNDANDGIAFVTNGGSNLMHNSNKIWTAGNDGSGSGLDADTLDGVNSGSFLRSDTNDTSSGKLSFEFQVTNLNSVSGSGGVTPFRSSFQASNRPGTGNYFTGAEYTFADTGARAQLGFGSSGNNTIPHLYARTEGWSGSNGWHNWYLFWHAGNDGSGSGLDADTVDGINSGSFLRSDADDTWSGNISTTSSNGIRFGNANQTDTNDGYIAAGRFGTGLNIVGTQTSSGTGRQVRIWGSVITDGGNTYWHGGNDGSGSGLDADTLDGQQLSAIARLDYDNVGEVRATNFKTLNGGTSFFYTSSGNLRGYIMASESDPHLRIATSGNESIGFYDGGTSGTENIRITGGGDLELYQGHLQLQNGLELRSKDTGGNVRTITRINSSNQLEYGWSANGHVKFMGGGSYTERMRIDSTGFIQINSHSNSWDGGLRFISQDGTDTFQMHPDNNGYMYVDKTWYFTSAPHIGSIGSPLWHPGNDGSGSGLDADTVDGLHKDFLMHYKGTVSGNWDTIFSQTDGHMGVYEVQNISNTDTNYPSGSYTYGGVLSWQLDNSTFKLYAPHTGTLWYQTGWNNDEYSGWRKIWDNNNDGSGSGLDADLLDGQHGSYYAPASGANYIPAAGTWMGANFNGSRHSGLSVNGGVVTFIRDHPNTSQMSVIADGAYYAGENNGFYSLYSGNSYNNKVGFYGDSSGNAQFSSAGPYFQNNTAHGYIQLGPMNTSYAHIYTNISGGFYFNRTALYANGNTMWHAGNDGSGSGLDADLVDGIHGTSLLRSDASDTFGSTSSNQYIRFNCNSGQYIASGGSSSRFPIEIYGPTTNGGDAAITFHINGDYAGFFGLASDWNDLAWGGWSVGSTTKYRIAHTGNFSSTGIWYSGNDGSGSGLDADTLDGQHASAFLTSFTETNAFIGDGGNASTHPGTSRAIYSGQVSAGTSVLGMPTINNANSFLNLNKHSGEYNSQLGFSSNGNIYYRNFNNTAINSTATWRTIWDSGNDGSGSGLDADTLDGMQSNSSNVASTIVARNSSGDFTARYIFATHFNQSSSNTENPTIGAFWTNSTADTYCRKSTPAHVISQLGLFTSSNDGSGSGLDADLLDGLHASSFLRLDSGSATPQGIPANRIKRFNSQAAIPTTSGSQSSLEVYGNNGAGTDAFMTFHVENDYALYFGLDGGTNDLAVGGWSKGANSYKVWHAGNDGSSSGLDADLLDGQHGSYYYGGVSRGTNQTYVVSSTSTSNRGNYGAGVWSYSGYSTGSNRPFTYDATLQVMASSAMGFELSVDWLSQSSTPLKIRSLRDCCQGWSYYSTIWTSSTDGSGSGLDADTVDGIQADKLLNDNGSEGDFRNQTSGSVGNLFLGHTPTSGTGSAFIITQKQTYSNQAGSILFYISPTSTTNTSTSTHLMHKFEADGDAHHDGDVIAYSTTTGSDRKLKENIRDLEGSLDKTLKLRGVKFDWKDKNKANDQLGFIAQEVEEILPEVVKEVETLTKEDETHLTVNYPAVVPLLVEAIKEQQSIINRLEERLSDLENKLK